MNFYVTKVSIRYVRCHPKLVKFIFDWMLTCTFVPVHYAYKAP